MGNPAHDVQDRINSKIDEQLNITPFYMGHVESNKIVIADKNGRPCAWISIEVMPREVALSLASIVARVMNNEFEKIMDEYDQQTGVISKLKADGKDMGQRITALLNMIGNAPGGDGVDGSLFG